MIKVIYNITRKIGRLLFSDERRKRILFWVQNYRKKIRILKNNLLEHGFNEKALADLTGLLNSRTYPGAKRLAAWELARWHANFRNEEGAFCCLNYLDLALRGVVSNEEKRQAAVMRAECYDILGQKENALEVLMNSLAQSPHPDLYLAAANLEAEVSDRIDWINQALEINGISRISINPSDGLLPYDWLTAEVNKTDYIVRTKTSPKVSVIIPIYNSADILGTALDSILAQTWENIEVLLVDDCSSDGTLQVIEEYAAKDSRVRWLSTPVNSGPYVARNIALTEATGELVTTNDADDWSHPQKIATQVKHLLQNPEVIANMSEQVRATSELKFYRRGNYGNLIFSNMSSLMFYRQPVMQDLGFWDSVRFGADNELIHRLRKVYGKDFVVQLITGPLSFQRQTLDSLTGSGYFGYHGYYMGARKEYYESHQYYHQQEKSLYYDFPLLKRPFPVPEPFWIRREKKPSGRRQFDVVLVSDFRYGGSMVEINTREINAYKDKGMRIGLVQMYQFNYSSKKNISYEIRDLIDGEEIQILVYGEKIACKQLIVLNPAAVQERQRYIPDIKAGEVLVIIEQLPSANKREGVLSPYDPEKCDHLLKECFGQKGVWYPVNSELRKELNEHDEDLTGCVNLSDKDWINPDHNM